MTSLFISQVTIYPHQGRAEQLLAFASIVLNGCFIVKDVKIIDGPDGLFVAMPSRRAKDGSYRDICHPVNHEVRTLIEQAVLKAFFNSPQGRERARKAPVVIEELSQGRGQAMISDSDEESSPGIPLTTG
jgi:stage V sporulation protein G